MRVDINFWSADENNDVNSVCREKRNRSSKGYEMSKSSFGDATLMTE